MSGLAGFFAGRCMAFHKTLGYPWCCLDEEGHDGWCDGAEGHTPKGCTCDLDTPTSASLNHETETGETGACYEGC